MIRKILSYILILSFLACSNNYTKKDKVDPNLMNALKKYDTQTARKAFMKAEAEGDSSIWVLGLLYGFGNRKR